MTVEDMSIAIWEQLGEPTDLAPGTFDSAGDLTYDVGSSGGAKLLGWINRGISRVVSWKNKNGSIVRFRDLDERVFFQGFEESGTLQSAGTNTVVLAAGSSDVADYYNEMVITIDSNTGVGQSRVIADYDSGTLVATCGRSYDTTPDSTSTYSINKSFYEFMESTDAEVGNNILVDDKSKILTVTRLKDMKQETELEYRVKGDEFVSSYTRAGVPGVWWIEGNGIRFDYAVEDDRWYEANVRVLPEDLTAGSDEPQIPETYHEAVVMWCVWYGLKRDRDFTGAYSVKRDLEDFMQTVVSEHDYLMEEMDGGLQVVGYDGGYY